MTRDDGREIGKNRLRTKAHVQTAILRITRRRPQPAESAAARTHAAAARHQLHELRNAALLARSLRELRERVVQLIRAIINPKGVTRCRRTSDIGGWATQ